MDRKHGKKPFEWYRTCEHRFNSEFGFQSFPEPETVYDFTIPEAGTQCIETLELEKYVKRYGQRNLMLWLKLQDVNASYSGNFVHLRPGKQTSIIVKPEIEMTTAEFRTKLRVQSLINTYE